MRLVVHHPESNERDRWVAGLLESFPRSEVLAWTPGTSRPADFAFIWKASADFFENTPGLRGAFALGAGVDALLPVVPLHVPLVRLVDAGMAEPMSRYVAHAALRFRLGFDRVAPGAAWDDTRAAFLSADESPCVAGVLGLGALGAAVAKSLVSLGFETRGWSRVPKAIPGVRCHVGSGGLDAMLSRTNLLVNLLPLTPETALFLNAALFAGLPRGAHLVNVARGAHLDDAALLAALDSGRLSGATLDVFRTEPLPADHPFARHPRITVTPHVSARTLFAPALAQHTENLRALLGGVSPGALRGFVSRDRGY